MAYITWNYYEVWYHRRRCRILIPRDISQLWIVYYPDAAYWEMNVDFIGNRKGLEALRNAFAALAEKDDIIVYFPCKANDCLSVYNYFFSGAVFAIKNNKFVDMVFMKPNSLKVSDWKEIRKRIPETKGRQWGYNFQCEFRDMHKKEKDKYRREKPRVICNFDTVFFNAPSFEYPDLAYSIEKFLVPELEENFYEDIRDSNHLRGENYLWEYMLKYNSQKHYDFETGIFFWDTDIYQEAKKAAFENKSIEEG